MIRDLIVGEITGSPAITGDPGGTNLLRRGSSGAAVTYVQTVLKERAGQTSLNVDGVFGATTESAVKSIQKFFKIPINGTVDSKTWETIRYLGASTLAGATDNIKDKVLSMEVSLSLDSVSQISFEVSDPGLEMAKNNYWNLRRVVKFQEMVFEISSVEFRQGSAGESVRIEARNRACQLLKRNKTPSVFKGGNATVYASEQARSVGLKFFGENSTEQKNISQAGGDQNNESVWDVLKRAAGQNQFVMFETDGRLFFTSMQFLLGKFAIVNSSMSNGFFATPVRWLTNRPDPIPPIPGPAGNIILRGNETNEHVRFMQTVLKERAGQSQLVVSGTYDLATVAAVLNLKLFFSIPAINPKNNTADPIVDDNTWAVIRYLASSTIEDTSFIIRPLQMPTVRKSDDDFNAATLSFQVDPEYGDMLRPGMTIALKDIPDFENNYIITEVRWNEGTPDAVAVTARTPVEPQDATVAKKLAARIDLTGGGYSAITVEDAFNS